MERISDRFTFRKRVGNIKVISVDPLTKQKEFKTDDLILKLEVAQYPLKSWSQSRTLQQNQEGPVQPQKDDSSEVCAEDPYQFNNYFKIFETIAFAFFLFPFRISNKSGSQRRGWKKSENRDTIMIQEVFIQKIISAILHILILIRSFMLVYTCLSIKLRESPSKIFKILDFFSGGALSVAFTVTAWRKKDAFNQVHETTSKSKFGWKTCAVFIGISAVPVIEYFVLVALVIIGLKSTDPKALEKPLKEELDDMLIFGRLIHINKTEALVDQTMRFILKAGFCFNYFVMVLVRIHADILVFIAALSVWEIARKYLKIFRSEKKRSLQELSDLYLKMEREIGMINSCTGLIVLSWVMQMASYFIQAFFTVFANSDGWIKTLNLMVVLQHVATIFVAVTGHNTAMKCKSLLLDKEGQVHQLADTDGESDASPKIMIERWSPAFIGYLEMSEADIGVRGSEFFVISNKFVSELTGIMITYLLIMLQFNLDPSLVMPVTSHLNRTKVPMEN